MRKDALPTSEEMPVTPSPPLHFTPMNGRQYAQALVTDAIHAVTTETTIAMTTIALPPEEMANMISALTGWLAAAVVEICEDNDPTEFWKMFCQTSEAELS